MPYDVFISYRRATGVDDARLLQQALKARGYKVFFDYDSLRNGKFDEKIFLAIDEAPVFVLMMTESSLDKCSIEGDWVRLEIERALAGNKPILPIAPSSQKWSWPADLPDNIKSITTEQVSKLDKEQLFDESIDRFIIDRFPESLQQNHRSATPAFSTVAFASEVFFGREAEMTKLHEMLAAGKFPVITGPGGTGKSELARQYAKYYRNEYPGGLFQLDMEKAENWEEALTEKLLTPSSAPGIDVYEALGLKKSFKTEERPDSTTIISALNQRAEQLGCLLLVLDNIESVRAFLREQILEKLSFHHDIRLLATARSSDVSFRLGDHSKAFQLEDLSPEAALKLLLKDHSACSDKEIEAAKNIAKMLGNRVLYLRSIPALLDDLYSPYSGSYIRLSQALKNNLLETVSEGMDDVGDEDRTPTMLWKMTREALSLHPNGTSWVKLAQISSFFSPEGFPPRLLYYLWQDLVASSSDSQDGWRNDVPFVQALKILKQHGLLDVQKNRLRMHRLTREAVRQTALNDYPSIENDIAHSLFGKMIQEYEWLFLSDNINILRLIPKRYFDGFLFYHLLEANQDYEIYCHWDELSGYKWAALLADHPRFADKCSWEKLNGYDWAILLLKQPQFAEFCNWKKLNGLDWSLLLADQPQFENYCSWWKLEGRNWADLLTKQPQFSIHCPWDELGGKDWSLLLIKQPQFSVYCSWEKFDNSFNWCDLLQERPEFAEFCSWEALDEYFSWESLLCKQPQFADKCPWDKLKDNDWARLLQYQPQFANQCPWDNLNYDGYNWGFLLLKQPQFALKIPLEKVQFDGWVWGCLLQEQPQFADKCPWEKLDEGWIWADLLAKQPQFSDKCPWEKLNFSDWDKLLASQPQFAKFRPNYLLDI